MDRRSPRRRQGNCSVELNDYIRIVRRFWVSIVALTLMGVAAAAALSLLATPTYTASSSLFFTVRSGDTANELAQGSTYTERQVRSYARVAEAPVVLRPVIESLELQTTPAALAERIQIDVPTNTSVLDLSVVDDDPVRAAAIADAVARHLVVAVSDMAPRDADGLEAVRANVISEATIPTAWTTPRVAQNLALGALLGAMLGVGQALLRRTLDTRVRTSEDLAATTAIPIIASITAEPPGSDVGQVVIRAPGSPAAEGYRRLRTNLQFVTVGTRGRSLAISSSVSGEGKSTTAVNVALAVAATGQRVLLIDADLRRPQVARRLNLEGAAGLTTILIGRALLDDVVQPVQDGLDVVAAGPVPPNPSELLGSDAMRGLIDEALAAYDYVFLDTAPLIPVTDTAVLATMVGGILLVIGSGEVHRDQVADAIESVQAADGNVVGLVLNKLQARDEGHRASYYRREGYAAAPDNERNDASEEPMILPGAPQRREAAGADATIRISASDAGDGR